MYFNTIFQLISNLFDLLLPNIYYILITASVYIPLMFFFCLPDAVFLIFYEDNVLVLHGISLYHY